MEEKDIGDPSKDLNALLQMYTGRISEEIFKGYFLPFFAGKDGSEKDNELYKKKAAEWVSIAGNPFHPVNIVDTNGQILFVVPAMFSREALQINDRSRINLSNTFVSAEQYRKVFGPKGDRYMDSAFNELHDQLQIPGFQKKYLEVWQMIFERYGYTDMLTEEKKKEVQSETKPNSLIPDDFDLM